MRPPMVILASGRGTNAEAVIRATRSGRLSAEVASIVTDVADAGVLAVAARHGIPGILVGPAPGETRRDYDRRLALEVDSHDPAVVLLAGWMRILSAAFLGAVRCPVVNLHPALPGDLPGLGAIERAHAERGAGRTHSGVMVHFVPDEEVDAGPVIATRRVALHSDDTLEEFAARMHAAEHELVVEAIDAVLSAHPPRSGDRMRQESTGMESR